MTRESSSYIPFDPEIERTALRRLRARDQESPPANEESIGDTTTVPMDLNPPNPNEAQQRTMSYYARPNLEGSQSSIVRPAVANNNFEIKSSIIQMVQNSVTFDGLPDEDPNTHISNFLEICDTFKINGVTDDAIRLRLFPFSLRLKAKQWLGSLPRGSITTWAEMAGKFLTKYFPPAKTAQMRADIASFMQSDSETLYDTWERFKEFLRRCPHHALENWQQIQIFYNGLNFQTRQMIDAAAGGTLNNKTPEAAHDLFEEMAINAYQWNISRARPSKPTNVFEINAATNLALQVERLTKQVAEMTASSATPPWANQNLIEEHVDYLGNPSRPSYNPNTAPYNNTFNAGYRNHPNFSWSNQGNAQRPVNFNPALNYPPPLNSNPNFPTQPVKPFSFEEVFTKYVATNESNIRNLTGSIKNLENQVGQLAQMFSERPQGALPGNTEPNPRGSVNAITIYSENEATKIPDEPKVLLSSSPPPPSFISASSLPSTLASHASSSTLSSPSDLKNESDDENFKYFLQFLKQNNFDISFFDNISKLPKYALDLKEIFSNKLKIEDVSNISFKPDVSAIVQNELPKKVNDPGRFSIPCQFGNSLVKNALADLGASINVMPFSLFQKLDLGKPSPTHMRIQLADKSVHHPIGIVEDVLVHVDKFTIPVDFVILDFEEDADIPLILGRPFLATSRAIFDVSNGTLLLRVGDNEVTFNIHPSMNPSLSNDESCFYIAENHDNDSPSSPSLSPSLHSSYDFPQPTTRTFEKHLSCPAQPGPPSPTNIKINGSSYET